MWHVLGVYSSILTQTVLSFKREYRQCLWVSGRHGQFSQTESVIVGSHFENGQIEKFEKGSRIISLRAPQSLNVVNVYEVLAHVDNIEAARGQNIATAMPRLV